MDGYYTNQTELSPNHPNNSQIDYDIEKSVSLTLLSLIPVCAVFGNLYILVCILGSSSLQRPGHLFLASLAITDMILAITVMVPRLSDQIQGGWHFGYFLCQVIIAKYSEILAL